MFSSVTDELRSKSNATVQTKGNFLECIFSLASAFGEKYFHLHNVLIQQLVSGGWKRVLAIAVPFDFLLNVTRLQTGFRWNISCINIQKKVIWKKLYGIKITGPYQKFKKVSQTLNNCKISFPIQNAGFMESKSYSHLKLVKQLCDTSQLPSTVCDNLCYICKRF